MKRLGILFEVSEKKKKKGGNGKPDANGRDKKPSYWRTVHGQSIGFDGEPPNGRPVIGPKQITKYLMVPKDESINEGVFVEASIAKMNRKAKKAGGKSAKPTKKIKARPAPLSVPLTKGGAALQTMLQGRQKLIKAVEADADDIKYASVDVQDLKYVDESDILKGNIGVILVLDASPPTVYEDVDGEVEYTVSCGGSGEDDFDRTEDYDSEFADGSITLRFFATLGKNGKPEYRLFDSEYSESSGFSDSSYFEDCIGAAKGKVLDAADLDGFIDEFMPSEDTILDAFADDLSERNYRSDDCEGDGEGEYRRSRW